MVHDCLHGTSVRAALKPNRTTEWSIRLRCKRMETARLPAIKLVINANWHKRQALFQLLYSLVSVGHVMWEDTVVVLGGGGVDIPPQSHLVSTFAGVPDSAVYSTDAHATNATLAVVHTAEQAFDYHGYHALWRYRHHRLVAAQGYLYTVDTSLAHPGFPARLRDLGKAFQRQESKMCSMQVFSVPLPNANLCAFGFGVVLNYGNNFHLTNLTKREAVDIEKGCADSRAHPLVDFAGSLVTQHERKSCGAHDVYVTRRSPRLCWYYYDLRLMKFHDARAHVAR